MRLVPNPNLLISLLGSAALVLGGCSFVVDADSLVGPNADQGNNTPDTGMMDMGVMPDGGAGDMGPVCDPACGGFFPVCDPNGTCVECGDGFPCGPGLDCVVGFCEVVNPGTCDVAACGPTDICVMAGGGHVCFPCDLDGDGAYFEDNPDCVQLALEDGADLDCDDDDPNAFPGMPPICVDGIVQGCLTEQIDLVEQSLRSSGFSVAELGVLPVVSMGDASMSTDLSVAALPGTWRFAGEILPQSADNNGARWVAGFQMGNDNQVSIAHFRNDNGPGQTEWVFDGDIGKPADLYSGLTTGDQWEVQSGAELDVAYGDGQLVWGVRGLRFGTDAIALIADDGTALNEVAQYAPTIDTQRGIAVRATTPGQELFVLENITPAGARIRSVNATASNMLPPHARIADGLVTSGAFSFGVTIPNDISAWAGGSAPIESVQDNLVTRPAPDVVRAARVGTIGEDHIVLAAYSSELVLTRFTCAGMPPSSCTPTSTTLPLPGTGPYVYDLEVIGNHIFVFRVLSGEVTATVFRLGNGADVTLVGTPDMVIMDAQDLGGALSIPRIDAARITVAETGGQWAEIVVGAVAVGTSGSEIFMSSLRFCQAF